MIALNVTQMKPVRGGVGYMATCSECGRRNRLSQHQAKYYISPDTKGAVWVMICNTCRDHCVVDVSAQQSVESDAACTCDVLSVMGGVMLGYKKDCPVPSHAADACRSKLRS